MQNRTPASRRPAPAGILVVEDQDDVRLMLVTALRLEGYRVEEARTAVEGLRRLERGAFELVLTDYAMPGHTGLWMLQQAERKGWLPGPPVLVVTAHPDFVPDDPHYTVIGKPIDLDSFLQQIHDLVDH